MSLALSISPEVLMNRGEGGLRQLFLGRAREETEPLEFQQPQLGVENRNRKQKLRCDYD